MTDKEICEKYPDIIRRMNEDRNQDISIIARAKQNIPQLYKKVYIEHGGDNQETREAIIDLLYRRERAKYLEKAITEMQVKYDQAYTVMTDKENQDQFTLERYDNLKDKLLKETGQVKEYSEMFSRSPGMASRDEEFRRFFINHQNNFEEIKRLADRTGKQDDFEKWEKEYTEAIKGANKKMLYNLFHGIQ